MRNDLQQPPHSVTLSELMNPWYKGAQPCLVTGIRTSFHVACCLVGVVGGRGGLLTLWAARILLKFSSSHALTLGLWVIWTCGACHWIVSCTLCNGVSPKPNGRQVYRWRRWENVKMTKKRLKFSEDFSKVSLISKVRFIISLLRVRRLKWYRVLLLINSSFNHNAMPAGKFAQVMNSC